MRNWSIGFWLPYVFLFSLFAQAGAVDLRQCFANETWALNPPGITYRECVQRCGGGAGAIKWMMFSQNFCMWLLPWIALIFQLPFGATDRIDNLVSVLAAIGSPALAGYSLAITRLNSRWLSLQFAKLHKLHYSNKANICQAISALQHIPFTINRSGSLLPSLIVLPQNDRYWKVLAAAAKRTRQWSIPMAMNIVWVLVAFTFTIVDSFVEFDAFITIPGDAGYSITAVWTYLLPLVAGWLYVGSQTGAGHLRDALEDAHGVAYLATTSEPVLANRVSGPTCAIEPLTEHSDYVNADEKRSAPIFNYARVFIWSQHAEYILKLCQHAANKAGDNIPVHCEGVRTSDGPDVIVAQDRVGNEVEVVRYCMEGPDIDIDPGRRHDDPRLPLSISLKPSATAVPTIETNTNANLASTHSAIPSASSGGNKETQHAEAPEKPVFAAEVFWRVTVAALLGLGLQWGTTGASILIHLNTPPKGFGCRALTFATYGIAGTVAFWLLLFSSTIAHLARRQNVQENHPALNIIRHLAALTRWLGKFIAIVNGFAILVTCTMQFAGIYDSCFCSSDIFSGRDPNKRFSFSASNIRGSDVYEYWIGGVVMAFATSGLYSFALYITNRR